MDTAQEPDEAKRSPPQVDAVTLKREPLLNKDYRMRPDRATLLAAAAARKTLATELLCDLIRLDTTNLPGNEYLVADYVEAFCKKRNISFKRYDPGGGRVSLIAEIGSGHSPRLFIPAHSDVVPAGEGWSVPPFGGVIKDGYVWGRGATDDKGPLAGLLAAADYLKTIESELEGTLLLGVIADEERGSVAGLDWLLKTYDIKADFAFVPDIAGFLRVVEVAEKGLVNIRVTFFGKQAHSSTPKEGVSALSALAELLYQTENWLPAGSAQAHPLLSPTTCVIAQAQAGVAHNIVPGKAEAVYNLRFLPHQSEEAITQELRELANAVAAKRPGITVKVELISSLAPSEVQTDQPVAQALYKAIAEITGDAPQFIGVGGATLCKQLIWAGIPAVAFGPGDPGLAHMADERIEIEELVRYTAVVMGATLNAVGKAV